MAVVKNITHDVLSLGTPDGAQVRGGKPVEVPDEEFVGRAWPKSTWELVKKPGKGYTDASIEDAHVFVSTTTDTAEADEEKS